MNDEARDVAKALAMLVDALRTHSLVHSTSDPEPDVVMRSFESLASALTAYREAIAGSSGWGVPYSVTDDEDSGWGESEDPGLFRVVAEYLMRVENFYEAKQFVKQRMVSSERPFSDDEIADASDVLRLLFEADGWKPENYDGPVRLGGPWTLDIGRA